MGRPKLSAWDKRGSYLAKCFGMDLKDFKDGIDRAMEPGQRAPNESSGAVSSAPRKAVRRRKPATIGTVV